MTSHTEMYVELEIMPGKGGVTAHTSCQGVKLEGLGREDILWRVFWGVILGSLHSAACMTTKNNHPKVGRIQIFNLWTETWRDRGGTRFHTNSNMTTWRCLVGCGPDTLILRTTAFSGFVLSTREDILENRYPWRWVMSFATFYWFSVNYTPMNCF